MACLSAYLALATLIKEVTFLLDLDFPSVTLKIASQFLSDFPIQEEASFSEDQPVFYDLRLASDQFRGRFVEELR